MRRPTSGFPLRSAMGLAALLGLAACSDSNEPSDQPNIIMMNPRAVPAGLGHFQLAIYGENFGPGSTVYWDGEPLYTASYEPTVVYAAVSPERTETAGTVKITVAGPTGKRSHAANFIVGDEYLEPAMTITSVSPAQGSTGIGDIEITITGSGFIPGTALFVEYDQLQSTRVSSTTLRAVIPAGFLQVNRPIDLRLGVPGFWVAAIPFLWEIHAPVPAIASLDPTSATAGSEELTVRVLGSGFATTSVVRVNGGDRTTIFVNGGELGVSLTPADLANGGTLAFTVYTPAPGGGLSPAANFETSIEAPELTLLPLLGVTAGRPGFSLVVHGRNFSAGTLLQWNGSDRPTQLRSGRRLMATISAADIAAPGQATITVRTPGFPTTSPLTLTIHPAPSSTVTSIQSLNMAASWLTVDPVSGRLFASVPGSVAVHGNSVAEIDPAGASVVTSVFVGSEPGAAEVSDDGQYLYVGLDGAQSVRRVSLPGLTPGLQFSLGSSLQAEELHVMPGRPQTIAVSRRSPGSSPSNSGLVIYDDGVARPQMGPGHTGSNTFGWTRDASAIFGYNFESSEFGLRKVRIGPEGATEVWVRSGLIDNYFTRIQVAGDQIYGGDGSVVDGDLRERLGSCGMSGWLTVDRALGRAYYWSDATIRVCELATYQTIGELTIPGVVGPHPAARHNMVRWGTDGLAFSDGAQIFLVRTPLAAP